ncbi:MAG: hypothetical protein SOU51_03595 [Collinsella sp.]|nr:hypothetical protein [Collinsella sp.]
MRTRGGFSTFFAVGDRAQATVEAAIVIPVMVVLALISFNLMRFVSAAARFDRVAPDIVLAKGVSPEGEASSASQAVEEELARAMGGGAISVKVDVHGSSATGAEGPLLSLSGSLVTYRCTMRYEVWPTRFSMAGIDLGAPLMLEHVRDVVVDPWRPGVVV